MTKLESYKLKSAIKELIDVRFDLKVLGDKYQDKLARTAIERIDKLLLRLGEKPRA